MFNTNKIVQEAPYGLYESWTPLQQKRHNFYVACLFVDQRGRVLVVEEGGEWTLPQQVHHHIVGIYPAFENLLSLHELQLTVRPKKARVYDPYENPTPEDPIFAVVEAHVVCGSSAKRRWVASAEELLKLKSVHPIVLAAAQAGMPTSLAWQAVQTSLS